MQSDQCRFFGAVLRHRYGDNKFIAWYTPFINCYIYRAFLYQQMTSGARLMEAMTGLPYVWGLVIFGVVLLAYTIFGGSKGTRGGFYFPGLYNDCNDGRPGYWRYYLCPLGGNRNFDCGLSGNGFLTSPEILSPASQFGFATFAAYLFQVGFPGILARIM